MMMNPNQSQISNTNTNPNLNHRYSHSSSQESTLSLSLTESTPLTAASTDLTSSSTSAAGNIACVDPIIKPSSRSVSSLYPQSTKGRIVALLGLALVIIFVVMMIMMLASLVFHVKSFSLSLPTTTSHHNSNHPVPSSFTLSSSASSSSSSSHISSSPSPPTSSATSSSFVFPSNFLWGVATSAYQIEGAVNEDGRGRSIWDDFCESSVTDPSPILDDSSGRIACDHYHRMEHDVDLIQSLGFHAYRFSISWSRIITFQNRTHNNISNSNSSSDNITVINNMSMRINQPGIDFYNRLIDALLARNITPVVTMYHWDLPSALQQDDLNHGGGWLSRSTIDAFAFYCSVLLQHFGDRVTYWITLNEPWTVAVNGYGTGIHAPGIVSSDNKVYVAAHHLLLAHAAAAAQILQYRKKNNKHHSIRNISSLDDDDDIVRKRQPWRVGISHCGDYRYPLDAKNASHRLAAEQAMLFQWGWFVHPLVYGEYPPVMRERLGDKLPEFTAAEKALLMNSFDFLGLNYYSSLLASPALDDSSSSSSSSSSSTGGYWTDMGVHLTKDDSWTENAMGWSIVPDGLYQMLLWISRTYQSPILYVTENGSAEPDGAVPYEDEKRRQYFEEHLKACGKAMMLQRKQKENEKDHHHHHDDPVVRVRLRGYFAWSLMDNFEWQFGYQRRFGICHVDFDSNTATTSTTTPTLKRTPRSSAWFLRDTILAQGSNLNISSSSMNLSTAAAASDSDYTRRRLQHQQQQQQQLDMKKGKSRQLRRLLPPQVVVGYGSNVDAVKRAVQEGVNVVIWSFVDFRSIAVPSSSSSSRSRSSTINSSSSTISPTPVVVTVVTNLNLTAVRDTIHDLDAMGYNDTVHLMSVGGWNGPHLDAHVSAHAWWQAFGQQVGALFHGLDWDLEGNDDLRSPYNEFTWECLDKMVLISRLAKADGYIVGMAPPQSYLDLFGENHNHNFSRFVNLTDPSRQQDNHNNTNRSWHADFSYFGSNVYAYLLLLDQGHSGMDNDNNDNSIVDLVFVQLYESYSRAAMTLAMYPQMTPAMYLQQFVSATLDYRTRRMMELVTEVDFSSDPSHIICPQNSMKCNRVIRVPLSKLVVGLANGWAKNPNNKNNDKTLFLESGDLELAWKEFRRQGTLPRGAGFWTIDEEGTNDVHYARDLSRILLLFNDNDNNNDNESSSSSTEHATHNHCHNNNNNNSFNDSALEWTC